MTGNRSAEVVDPEQHQAIATGRREWESRPLPWREATGLADYAIANPTSAVRMRFSCD